MNLKRYVTAIGIVCCLTTHAQTSLGITSGLNLSTFGGNLEGNKLDPSFHAGLAICKPLNATLDLNSGIIFSSQGYRQKTNTMPEVGRGRFSYFNLPLTADVKISKVLAFRAGTQFSILSGASRGIEKSMNDVTGLCRPYDLSLITGIRFKLIGRLHAYSEYHLGLLNVYKEKDRGKFYNHVIQAGLTYFFSPIKSVENEN